MSRLTFLRIPCPFSLLQKDQTITSRALTTSASAHGSPVLVPSTLLKFPNFQRACPAYQILILQSRLRRSTPSNLLFETRLGSGKISYQMESYTLVLKPDAQKGSPYSHESRT